MSGFELLSRHQLSVASSLLAQPALCKAQLGVLLRMSHVACSPSLLLVALATSTRSKGNTKTKPQEIKYQLVLGVQVQAPDR